MSAAKTRRALADIHRLIRRRTAARFLHCIAVLDTVRQHAQRQCFDLGQSFLSRLS
jgi:hypothetical protein